MPRPWRWITPAVLWAIHDRLIAEHGGAPGIRDDNAVESALGRPQHRAAYDPVADAAALPAAYAFGFARNHGFVDGNKRVAWVTARLFLLDNAMAIAADPFDVIATIEALAAGNRSEDDLAAWFRQRIDVRDDVSRPRE